jgi:hypothetical protein
MCIYVRLKRIGYLEFKNFIFQIACSVALQILIFEPSEALLFIIDEQGRVEAIGSKKNIHKNELCSSIYTTHFIFKSLPNQIFNFIQSLLFLLQFYLPTEKQPHKIQQSIFYN